MLPPPKGDSARRTEVRLEDVLLAVVVNAGVLHRGIDSLLIERINAVILCEELTAAEARVAAMEEPASGKHGDTHEREDEQRREY